MHNAFVYARAQKRLQSYDFFLTCAIALSVLLSYALKWQINAFWDGFGIMKNRRVMSKVS
jgi:hypothetical protein